MIGRVAFTKEGEMIQAILGDDGQWTCVGGPEVAELLTSVCPSVGDPAEDAWGRAALIKAAQRLHGLAGLGPRAAGELAGTGKSSR